MASVLTSAQTACPAAISQCFFECDFPTCNSSDVACQCESSISAKFTLLHSALTFPSLGDGTYLQNIFSCASCNTANGNAGATQIADFQSLQESCVNQNYTGASQNFTTKALPTIATSALIASLHLEALALLTQ